MEHDNEELIKKLEIEKTLLLKAIDHVDSFVDKLCLEQDQMRILLDDFVNKPEPNPQSIPSSCGTPGTSQPMPVKPTPPQVTKPVYIMNEEENIEAINSQPLALDFDLDELIAPSKSEVNPES